jgi:DNA primase
MIFDLDPSEDDFEPVRDIAQALREKLERMDLPT